MSTPRIHVEAWDPAYGAPITPDDALAPSESEVDTTVETDDTWEPIRGEDDGVGDVWFVDGVERIDARITIDRGEGIPGSGLCGSIAVGAVRWDRIERRAEVAVERVERYVIVGEGETAPGITAGNLRYLPRSVASSDPGDLRKDLHNTMRQAEGELSRDLAEDGHFVVGDGPVSKETSREAVGYIKTHRVSYLSGHAAECVRALPVGHRTPLFLLGGSTAYPRYSWYSRIAERPDTHAWYGIVRGDVSQVVSEAVAARLAGRCAALLPLVAAPAHTDPRAPQNLVPIAALERALRRRLGDRGLTHRAIAGAVRGGA